MKVKLFFTSKRWVGWPIRSNGTSFTYLACIPVEFACETEHALERERERERESVDKRKGGLPMQSERVSDLKRDRERERERECARDNVCRCILPSLRPQVQRGL